MRQPCTCTYIRRARVIFIEGPEITKRHGQSSDDRERRNLHGGLVFRSGPHRSWAGPRPGDYRSVSRGPVDQSAIRAINSYTQHPRRLLLRRYPHFFCFFLRRFLPPASPPPPPAAAASGRLRIATHSCDGPYCFLRSRKKLSRTLATLNPYSKRAVTRWSSPDLGRSRASFGWSSALVLRTGLLARPQPD